MRWMSMLLAFVMALSATVSRADDKSDAERWAVLIGINDYAHARDLEVLPGRPAGSQGGTGPFRL